MTVQLQKNIDTNINDAPVTIRDWAQAVLTAEEYADYLEAESRNLALTKSYIDAGLMQQEIIKETVYVPAVGTTLTFDTGVKTTLAPGVTVLDIPIDPDWAVWHARYTSDPTINYNPTVQL
jgi:beta-glucosidase-like glycosyl hydrolase